MGILSASSSVNEEERAYGRCCRNEPAAIPMRMPFGARSRPSSRQRLPRSSKAATAKNIAVLAPSLRLSRSFAIALLSVSCGYAATDGNGLTGPSPARRQRHHQRREQGRHRDPRLPPPRRQLPGTSTPNPFLADYATNSCRNDAPAESWQIDVPSSAAECCARYFGWENPAGSCEQATRAWIIDQKNGAGDVREDDGVEYYPDSTTDVCRVVTVTTASWIVRESDYEECCRSWFGWNLAECLAADPAQSTYSPSSAGDVGDSSGGSGDVVVATSSAQPTYSPSSAGGVGDSSGGSGDVVVATSFGDGRSSPSSSDDFDGLVGVAAFSPPVAPNGLPPRPTTPSSATRDECDALTRKQCTESDPYCSWVLQSRGVDFCSTSCQFLPKEECTANSEQCEWQKRSGCTTLPVLVPNSSTFSNVGSSGNGSASSGSSSSVSSSSNDPLPILAHNHSPSSTVGGGNNGSSISGSSISSISSTGDDSLDCPSANNRDQCEAHPSQCMWHKKRGCSSSSSSSEDPPSTFAQNSSPSSNGSDSDSNSAISASSMSDSSSSNDRLPDLVQNSFSSSNVGGSGSGSAITGSRRSSTGDDSLDCPSANNRDQCEAHPSQCTWHKKRGCSGSSSSSEDPPSTFAQNSSPSSNGSDSGSNSAISASSMSDSSSSNDPIPVLVQNSSTSSAVGGSGSSSVITGSRRSSTSDDAIDCPSANNRDQCEAHPSQCTWHKKRCNARSSSNNNNPTDCDPKLYHPISVVERRCTNDSIFPAAWKDDPAKYFFVDGAECCAAFYANGPCEVADVCDTQWDEGCCCGLSKERCAKEEHLIILAQNPSLSSAVDGTGSGSAISESGSSSISSTGDDSIGCLSANNRDQCEAHPSQCTWHKKRGCSSSSSSREDPPSTFAQNSFPSSNGSGSGSSNDSSVSSSSDSSSSSDPLPVLVQNSSPSSAVGDSGSGSAISGSSSSISSSAGDDSIDCPSANRDQCEAHPSQCTWHKKRKCEPCTNCMVSNNAPSGSSFQGTSGAPPALANSKPTTTSRYDSAPAQMNPALPTELWWYYDDEDNSCKLDGPSRPKWITGIYREYEECCEDWDAEGCLLLISGSSVDSSAVRLRKFDSSLNGRDDEDATPPILLDLDLFGTVDLHLPILLSQTSNQWNLLKRVLTKSIVLLMADYSALVHPEIAVDLWSIDELDFTWRKRRLGEESVVEEEEGEGKLALPSSSLRGRKSVAVQQEPPQQRQRRRKEVAVQELKFELNIVTNCNGACQSDNLSPLGTLPFTLINDYFQTAVASGTFTLLLETEGKDMGLFADGLPTASNGVLTYVYAARSVLNDDEDFTWPSSIKHTPYPTDATDEQNSRGILVYYPDLHLAVCKFDGFQGNTLDLYSSLHECCLFPWMPDYGKCMSNSEMANI